MAALTTQKPVLGGTAITFGAADAAGDTFKGTQRGILLIKNNDAAAKTVTLVVPGNTAYGEAQPDKTISVAAGATVAVGPFDVGLRDSAGDVSVTYSAVTSVTVAYVEAY